MERLTRQNFLYKENKLMLDVKGTKLMPYVKQLVINIVLNVIDMYSCKVVYICTESILYKSD